MIDSSPAPNPGSAPFIAPSLEELAPLFPSYELEEFVAQGGMGAVYRARQTSLDRTVAIKILPREFGADEEFRKAFQEEAKAMARLNHPNLIAVYDFGDADGMLFIVMEFVMGSALHYSSHGQAIDPEVAMGLVSAISRGLGNAHRAGIIHRDIKPANILLNADASPKVGDFGLARSLGRERGGEVVFGTPGYTAPEVYTRAVAVDQRSDIFSLGALLYELLTGKAPEEHSHSMKSGVDSRLDAILAKATHPDPAYRFVSAEDFAAELEALIPKLKSPNFRAPAPGLASPIVRPRVQTLASSQSSSMLPILIILALLLGVGAFAFVSMKKKDAPVKKPTPGAPADVRADPDLPGPDEPLKNALATPKSDTDKEEEPVVID